MSSSLVFRCVDLETNGVDVDTCEVAQVAILEAPSVDGWPGMASAETSEVLCGVKRMPAAATRVHGLTFEMLAGQKPFIARVKSVVRALTEEQVIVVTFNGAGYDLPIIARYAAAHGRMTALLGDEARELFMGRLSLRHIDIMRLWKRAISLDIPWPDSPGLIPARDWEGLTAGMFRGSLKAAHGFWLGGGVEDAHNAGADCLATVGVLYQMLRTGFVTIEKAIQWTREPLPGDVDYVGKFKWEGDQVLISFGEQAGIPLEEVDRGFLTWILEKDFHQDTKRVVRLFLAGDYPVRNYESEST